MGRKKNIEVDGLVAEAQAEIASVEVALGKAIADIATVEAQQRQYERFSLRVAELKAERSLWEEQNKEIESEMLAKTSERERLITEIEALSKKASDLMVSIEESKTAIIQQNDRLSSLNKEISELSLSRDALRDEVAKLTDTQNGALVQISTKKAELDTRERELLERERANEDLNAELLLRKAVIDKRYDLLSLAQKSK